MNFDQHDAPSADRARVAAPASQDSLFVPGRNCWRLEHATRAAFLIDGEAYFTALAAALEHARHSVFLLGWDFDRRVPLVSAGNRHRYPTEVAGLLDSLVRERRRLHVHVLMWDFAMIYALERELLPVFRLALRTHRRFHFKMDGNHPVGASHHQKLVVIDDRLAFVGGFDIARSRWDTSEHAPDDPRRINPDGEHYVPFHDVQMMVEGDVAARLGELARERWRLATGGRLRRPRPRPKHRSKGASDSLWPRHVSPDLSDVQVAIARTLPAYHARAEVHEVEALYLDSIARAQRYIYIENQYFTSTRIGRALAERLQEPDGPEVVLVLPQRSSGWLEETTMDVLRARVLRTLGAADAFSRLRIYYAYVPGLGKACLNVHSKTMVIDARFARVGSSNTSNRSMGLDTECDLAIDAAGAPRVGEAVARYHARLLGEHLGVPPERLIEPLMRGDSLIETIEALQSDRRSLRPLDLVVPASLDDLVPDAALLDPERPVDPDVLIEQYIPEEMRMPGRNAARRFLGLLVALVLLALLWRFTPLADYLEPDRLVALVGAWQAEPVAWVVIGAGFVLGSLLMLPLTLLIVVVAATLGPVVGFVYALAGSLLSGIIGYGAGRLLGQDVVRQLAGERINSLSRRIAAKGLLSMVTVRLIPVAPYTLVNLMAGASHIRLRDFTLGTLIGLLPGTVALVWFADSLTKVFRDPSLEAVLILAVAVGVMATGGLIMQRWLARRERQRAGKAVVDGS